MYYLLQIYNWFFNYSPLFCVVTVPIVLVICSNLFKCFEVEDQYNMGNSVALSNNKKYKKWHKKVEFKLIETLTVNIES